MNGPEPPVSPPTGKEWTLTYGAEFSGTSLDTTMLTACFDWNAGDCTSSFNRGTEHYHPSQVRLHDGVASLVAEPLIPPRPDGACFNGVCTYKSGLISTARPNPAGNYLYSFTYGYVEARLMLPTTRGMFTAFWMLPTSKDFQYDYEIDILENLAGLPDVIYQSYAYDKRNTIYRVNDASRGTNGQCANRDYSMDFHTYGVDWQPDHIAFYIDGRECGRFTATGAGQIASKPMQIILDLMVDTTWQRDVQLTSQNQTAIDRLDVDYLRVWQAR